MAIAERISKWGVVSLVLLIGDLAFGEYNFYVYDHGARPLLRFDVANQICVLVQLVAIFCAVVAVRRGSKWWTLLIVATLLRAVICFFGDL